MIFRLGKFVLDVDVEKTREFYARSAHTLTEGCDCIGCRNFMKAAKDFEPEIVDLFCSLGVDPCKAPDMSAMYGDGEKQILCYMGFYHLCGVILEGESAWVAASADSFRWDESRTYEVRPGYRVSFSDRNHLVEKGFPKPVIQMDAEFRVPWVMEEKHYLLTGC